MVAIWRNVVGLMATRLSAGFEADSQGGSNFKGSDPLNLQLQGV